MSSNSPKDNGGEKFGARHGFYQGGIQDRHMNDGLRSALWNVLYKHWPYGSEVRAAIWTDWAGMTLDELETQDNHDLQNKVERMEFLEPYEAAGVSPLDADSVLATVKKKYFEVPEGMRYTIYELVELVCEGLEGQRQEEFARDINSALARNRSAYTLSNGKFERAMPRLERDAVEEASKRSPTGKKHAERAMEHMRPTSPDYEASISESIKMVEHAAQEAGGRGNGLNGMVKDASRRLGLHPAMQEQLAQVYRFANKTSRHSELGKAYEPDSHDAKAVLVWCSAMANYLADKDAAAGPQGRAGGGPAAPARGDPSGPKGSPDHLARGRELLEHGRYAEALEAFEKAVGADAQSADAHHGMGRALFMGERHEEAVSAYGRAIALDGNHFMAHLDKGTALATMSRHKEAARAFERACMIKPRNAEARLKRAKSLYEVGRHEEALDSCRRAIEIEPDNPDVHATKADVLGELGRHEDALESIDRAIRLDRDDAGLHVKRGRTLDRLGRISDALAAYGRAIKMDPAMADRVPQP